MTADDVRKGLVFTAEVGGTVTTFRVRSRVKESGAWLCDVVGWCGHDGCARRGVIFTAAAIATLAR